MQQTCYVCRVCMPSASGNAWDACFLLFQRFSNTIQRYNSVLFRESFICSDDIEN